MGEQSQHQQSGITQVLAALAQQGATTPQPQQQQPSPTMAQSAAPAPASATQSPLSQAQGIAALLATAQANASTPPPQRSAAAPSASAEKPGAVDIAGVKPTNTGSVSIADAIAKARQVAAERGIAPAQNVGRIVDTRRDSRGYYPRSRSPSRSPPLRHGAREVFRDNYNPYRDERRADRRGVDRAYGGRDRERERSFSPPRGGGRPYRDSGSWDRGVERDNRERDRYVPAYADDRREPPTNDDENAETISVESSFVGLVIGRGGESLKRIEADTGTRVQFLEVDQTSSVRFCRIQGPPAARQHAKSEIQKIISESNSGPARGMPSARGMPERGAPVRGALTEGDSMQIMVPDRTVGLIIGRGGETIRDLQDRSGCRLNIVNENQSINGLRPVNLKGSEEAKQKAKDLIMEIVESDTRQGANAASRGGPSGDAGRITETIMIPPEAVGLIIGKGGETIRDIQNMSQCRVNIQRSADRSAEREVTLTGPRSAIDAAKGIIQEKIDSTSTRQPPRRPPGGSSYGGGDQYQDDSQPYYQDPSSMNMAMNMGNMMNAMGGASGGYPGAQDPQQQAAAAAAGSNGADPYAAYGGYQNYVAMWCAAMAQQQQQPQQGPGSSGAGDGA